MRMEVEQLSRGLQEGGSARSHVGAVKMAVEVELQGSPSAAGQSSQEPAVIPKEDSEPFGNGEHHLAVGDVFDPSHAGRKSEPPPGLPCGCSNGRS